MKGPSSLSNDLKAIAASTLFLALGLLVIWFTKDRLKITSDSDAIFISLLLIPVVVFLIFSGRLRELKAPGGLEAKFADEARRSVDIAAETIEASVEDMQIVAKGGMQELKKRAPSLDESKPSVLALTLGPRAPAPSY